MRFFKGLVLLLGFMLPSLGYAATLTWVDNANNEAGFVVKRRLTQKQAGTDVVVNPGAFGPLIQLQTPDLTGYVDASAVADINYDNEYCYMVSAFNFDLAGTLQESPNSNAACILIPRPVPPVIVPAAPSNLAVTP